MSMSLKKLHIIILFISVVSLVSAYFVEYIMALAGCHLCIYQRFPYLLLIMISIIGLSSNQSLRQYYIITFLISILLASYHTGIERGIFEVSIFCKPLVSISDNLSVSDFKNILYNEKLGTCNKPVLFILGLSMAEWNLFLNIMLLFSTTLIKIKQD
ncbi:MAG: disulfide bond formation protein B [Rickettsiales bacterium]|nr:MAG: disulfide bond formation protein B [Rickettsiales bacterium]